MDKFYHAVKLDEDLCKGCINCIKHCPTQAIRVRNGKARINSKFCIDCGECIRMCPHHAKIADFDKLKDIKKYKYTIALPAPSLYGQFNNLDDINIVLNALLLMGFDDVFEVGAAAEIISSQTRDYLEKQDISYPVISTACPSVVRLIRVRFPSLIPYLLPFIQPVELAAKIAVRNAINKTGYSRKDIGVFFISPCPSKVSYAKSPIGVEESEIDEVLAMKDIYPGMLPFLKTAELSKDNLKNTVSTIGRLGVSWGRSGGESSGLFQDDYLAADGIKNVIRVLEDLEDEKFTKLRFIELNACDGGCVGGVFTVENPYIAEVKLNRLRKYLPVSGENDIEEEYEEVRWEHELEYEPVFNLGSNIKESFMRLNQAERLMKKLPGLDCGSCGAPTCKALAEDIVRGDAKEEDCIYYFKERLHEISKEIASFARNSERDDKNDEEVLGAMIQYIEKLSDDIGKLDVINPDRKKTK